MKLGQYIFLFREHVHTMYICLNLLCILYEYAFAIAVIFVVIVRENVCYFLLSI